MIIVIYTGHSHIMFEALRRKEISYGGACLALGLEGAGIGTLYTSVNNSLMMLSSLFPSLPYNLQLQDFLPSYFLCKPNHPMPVSTYALKPVFMGIVHEVN